MSAIYNTFINLDTLQGKSHLCFPFWELRGLSPNFHIHVSVSVEFIFPGLVHIYTVDRGLH
jgi:hypothetical protein